MIYNILFQEIHQDDKKHFRIACCGIMSFLGYLGLGCVLL